MLSPGDSNPRPSPSRGTSTINSLLAFTVYCNQDTTHPSLSSRFSTKTTDAQATRLVALETSRRDLSIDAPLGFCSYSRRCRVNQLKTSIRPKGVRYLDYSMQHVRTRYIYLVQLVPISVGPPDVKYRNSSCPLLSCLKVGVATWFRYFSLAYVQ